MLSPNYSEYEFECGTDEAGRGCLAGPVTAAAVILPKGFSNTALNDSKQLTEAKRFLLKPIIENEAISFGVSHVFQKEIDKINILNASILAMHNAIEQLQPTPQYIIVDGNKFKPYKNIKYETIVKGDSKFLSIAAASVLAKTYRDLYMDTIHEEYPMYQWNQNKGYPTKAHLSALLQFGITPQHRKSYAPVKKFLNKGL